MSMGTSQGPVGPDLGRQDLQRRQHGEDDRDPDVLQVARLFVTVLVRRRSVVAVDVLGQAPSVSVMVSSLFMSGGDQVDEGEDEDPDDVDEVPVQADHLDRLGLLADQLALGKHRDE